MKRPSDDTRLVEALWARLSSTRGSSSLPQIGEMSGLLRMGEHEVEVTLTVRRTVTYDLRACYRDRALERLATRNPNILLSSCGCSTTKRNAWSRHSYASCSKPITHVVVLAGHRSYFEPYDARGPWPPTFYFRCAVHAEKHGFDPSAVLATLKLPEAALGVLRTKAQRAEDARRHQEHLAEVCMAWGRRFIRELLRPSDDLSRARDRAARDRSIHALGTWRRP